MQPHVGLAVEFSQPHCHCRTTFAADNSNDNDRTTIELLTITTIRPKQRQQQQNSNRSSKNNNHNNNEVHYNITLQPSILSCISALGYTTWRSTSFIGELQEHVQCFIATPGAVGAGSALISCLNGESGGVSRQSLACWC